MDSFTQFVMLTVLSFFGLFCVYVRRKFFVYIPKDKKFVNDYVMDFIEWILISWPPLIPLVGVIQNSGQDMGWYLAPYFGVIIGIFFVWFTTTKNEKKRRQTYLTISVVIVNWIIIGFLIFLQIIH